MVYKYESGLWQAGSYQASGRPWVTASLDIGTLADGGDPAFEIQFPLVTRWIIVNNIDETQDVKVAFSPSGYNTFNYFTVGADTGDYTNTQTQRLELKITKLYLSGASNNVEVIAGLTDIKTTELPLSWSGSAGVG